MQNLQIGNVAFSPKNNIRLVRRSSDSHIYFGNTPYDFLVHLPKQLYLQGHWTVSLLDFDLSTIFTQQELYVWRRRKKNGDLWVKYIHKCIVSVYRTQLMKSTLQSSRTEIQCTGIRLWYLDALRLFTFHPQVTGVLAMLTMANRYYCSIESDKNEGVLMMI